MATIQDELSFTSTDATEVSLPIAGTGSRSYAFLIDWHIRLVLALAWFFGVAYLLVGVENFLDDVGGVFGTWVFYVVLAPALAIYFLYHPLLEITMKGRTPGKRLAGIRIVSTSGETPSVGALLIRNVFRLVDALPSFYILGLVVVMATPRHVRIGDIAAGTLLVHERKLGRDAFAAVAEAADGSMDLATREVASDLLRRWKRLEPAVRRRIATRLLESLGTEPPAVPRAELDDALRRELGARLDAGRG
ncbi:MAG: RDD family protein [Gammaproteobacteria bacterium]|nr:RDD family protein [Gammaproteobacteria bacterium]